MEYMLLPQTFWTILISIYLFLGGLGGATSILVYYFWRRYRSERLVLIGGLIAFVALLVGTVMLVLDLVAPNRAFIIYVSPRVNFVSWIEKGVWIITLYMIVALLYALPFFPGFDRLGWRRWRWPWIVIEALMIIGIVLGVLTAIYTGFVLSVIESVAFWHTSLLPVLFFVGGFSAACAAYAATLLLMSFFSKDYLARDPNLKFEETLHTLEKLDLLALSIELALIFAVILHGLYGGPGAYESAMELLVGSLAPLFWGLLVGLGIITPIILYFVMHLTELESKVVPFVTCALVIAGAFALRYLIIVSGYIPVPIAP